MQTPSTIVWATAAAAAAVGVLAALPSGPAPGSSDRTLATYTAGAVVFHEWAKTYGDVMYLEVLGNPMIVLNTEQVAVDLLNKRSAIYSDRPQFPLHEMIGWSTTLSLMPYGKRFNVHRQLHNAYLNRTKCREYRPMQTLEARTLAKNLLESAREKYNKLVNRFSTGVISQIVAGHRISSDDDPYMKTTEALHVSLGRLGVPGTTSLDYFPFRMFCVRLRALNCAELFSRVFHTVQLLKNVDPDKWAGAAMFGSTIWSTVTVFILAMLHHPEYQAKGQQEIDSVVGKARLPGFDDRENLPFVECIMHEVWAYRNCRTAAPLPQQLPHWTAWCRTDVTLPQCHAFVRSCGNLPKGSRKLKMNQMAQIVAYHVGTLPMVSVFQQSGFHGMNTVGSRSNWLMVMSDTQGSQLS
ncbi:cytochrome P450 [Roridomyces roridus]|uniref:Cytochrome P450 n=1 Tax=Roridomyces roridus TaxID=1738132 RepID=A0AAD7B4Y2_9AGAR|nr:cytochrome P450 [Roridomyces roridus]